MLDGNSEHVAAYKDSESYSGKKSFSNTSKKSNKTKSKIKNILHFHAFCTKIRRKCEKFLIPFFVLHLGEAKMKFDK